MDVMGKKKGQDCLFKYWTCHHSDSICVFSFYHKANWCIDLENCPQWFNTLCITKVSTPMVNTFSQYVTYYQNSKVQVIVVVLLCLMSLNFLSSYLSVISFMYFFNLCLILLQDYVILFCPCLHNAQ